MEESNLLECEKIQDRIARLASGIAIIRVGGATEVEMIERKHRIEDALEAVRSAQMEGIVPGGGVALMRATLDLEVETDNADQAIGVQIIKQAIEGPLRQMATNAGLSPDIICETVRESTKDGNYGYNFVTNSVEDLFETGVIDPVKVTRTSLQNAASVAGTLITTNYAVIQN